MGKKVKTPEQVDLETCRDMMGIIERTCHNAGACGSELLCRSWFSDNENHVKVATVYEDTVKTLRAAYRRLSEAEELLEHEPGAIAPPVKRGIVRRMLLLGDGS